MSHILLAKNLPPRVEKLVKEITEKSPKYTEAQVWATAWSIYCKHIKPGDGHCSKGPDDYLTHQTGARTAMNFTTVSTTMLPKAVLKVLAEVRFNKRKISITQATSFSMYSAGDDGAKGFTALVDLDTNQASVTWGAFGGGGLAQKQSPVDDVNTPRKPLPDHLVVVQGQVGGRDPYASLTCTPAAFHRLTGAPRVAGAKTAYFTVQLPPGASKWQSPTKVLSRGAFKSRREAFEWAAKNVPGVEVTLVEYDDPEVVEKAMIQVAIEVHKNGEQGTFQRHVNPVGAKALLEDHLVVAERGMLYPKQPAFDRFFKYLHGVHASVGRVAARYVRAFNKFNAPELVSQLLAVLEQEGLKDALNQVKMKKVPEIIEKAWSSRGKTAAVKVPVTIRDWQLFNSNGAGAAAKALTTALKAAVKALNTVLATPAYRNLDPRWAVNDRKALGQTLAKLYHQHMSSVMSQHRALGAEDTEPRNVAIQCLVDTVKEFYRVTGYLGLGEYI